MPIPVVGDLAAASGLSAWVSAHREWWEGLLTIYFGFMAGGWLGAKTHADALLLGEVGHETVERPRGER
ncbi:MAG: hypothetical protein M3R38_06220 [Actinomycetota bacterium]|nr:hypothetical protein [Actinomycetota bacterium]MDP9475279.1 hypothetical protein [Actinomycetota bacterium]MDP9484331.1 hypothetical protein [Actinomycetota bacterium]